MTNGEANAIDVLVRHLLGQDAAGYGRQQPSEVAVRDALVHLAERAHRHMAAGATGGRVRLLWDQLHSPSETATKASDTTAERLRTQLSVVIGQTVDAAGLVREALETRSSRGQRENLNRALDLLDDISEAHRCETCGCTQTSPCEDDEAGPCGWAEPHRCTACVSP